MKLKDTIPIIIILISIYGISQPTQVKDIYNGSQSSSPQNLYAYNGLVYFSAWDASGFNSPGGVNLGRELWVSDGTSGGTVLLKDLRPGSNGSFPRFFFEFNGKLYFTATNTESTLWTSDGSDGGTTVIDIMPSEFNEDPSNATVLGGLVYLKVNTSEGSGRLVEWDGTNTAVPVANVDSNMGTESIVGDIIELNGKLLTFMNYSTQSSTVGYELYEYDPAVDLFSLIKDISPGSNGSAINSFAKIGSTVYFSALGELWQTNGTEGSTMEVSATASQNIDGVKNVYAWNGKIYFDGDGSFMENDQLWAYDPVGNTVTNVSNQAGTLPSHYPAEFVSLNGWLYYRGENSEDTANRLWRTDGVNIYQLGDSVFNVDDIVALNGKIYFEGSNGSDGNELFEFDPATLGVNNLADDSKVIIYPNPSSDIINIQTNTLINKVEIYNYLGKKLNSYSNKDLINLNQLESGIYVVKIFGKNSNSSVSRFVIKN